MLGIIVTSAASALACVLVVAIAHKLRTIARRAAADEPLLATGGWTRSHPDTALAAAALAELGIALLLVAAPGPGLLGFCCLVSLYAWRLRTLDPDTGCNCFGELLRPRDTNQAIRRNVVLAAATLVAGALASLGAIEPAGLSGTVLAIVAIPIAMVVALQLVDRQFGVRRDLRRI